MGAVRKLLLLCLLLSLTSARAATPPPQWLPRESWPGGKQYDPRLERTVRFWGTGVPAADLFASIVTQTGVPLAFSPLDDDNARICLNVYLNPKDPPTLRDLLVQIGWTMDCAWALEGEGEQSRYLLLHTSIGDGALERLERRQKGESADERRAVEQAVATGRAAAIAKLRSLEGALNLSREAAIARYQGKDDLVLLILLDPGKRALAQFLLTIADTLDAARSSPLGWTELRWGELTDEQRAQLRQAMQPLMEDEERMRREAGEAPDPAGADWPTLEGRGLRAGVSFLDFGGIACTVSYPVTDAEGPSPRRADGEAPAYVRRHLGSQLVQLVTDPEFGDCEVVDPGVQLRRLLGEGVTEEEWQALRQRRDQQQSEAEFRRHAEREVAALTSLSPEGLALLSSLRLPVDPDRTYSLWQLQELIASVSGLHIVSDCFLQAPTPLGQWLRVLDAEGNAGVSALAVLRAACASRQTPDALRPTFGIAPDWGAEGWEWGDAGHFLRFRSHNRDLWRASFLPATTVRALNARVEPYLPGALALGEGSLDVEVPLGLPADAAALCRLTPAQRRWGGLFAYGDPSDGVQRYRQAFIEGALTAAENLPYADSLFAKLGAEQYQRLCDEGLVLDVDVPLHDLPGLESHGFARGDTVRLELASAEVTHVIIDPGRRAADYTATDWRDLLFVRRDHGSEGYGSIPANLLLHPARLEHLVSPP
jgi:hypothetical protein